MPQMNKGGKFIFGQSIIQGQKTRRLRAGVYLFAIMEWVSAIGYRMFPLSDSGYAGAFQDVMHMVVTALVVLLSIVSLSVIVSAGLKDKSCRFYGVCAAIALATVCRSICPIATGCKRTTGSFPTPRAFCTTKWSTAARLRA